MSATSIFERKWVQRGIAMTLTSPLVYWALFTAGVSDVTSGLTSILWFIAGVMTVLFASTEELS